MVDGDLYSGALRRAEQRFIETVGTEHPFGELLTSCRSESNLITHVDLLYDRAGDLAPVFYR
jgi:hypothetical protein